MKVELKSIKYAAFASQETSCFSATVFVDGKKAGEVENDGHGGSNTYHPWQLKDTLDAYGKTLPLVKEDWCDEPFTQDAESIISDLLMDHLAVRDYVRISKKRILYTKKGMQGIYQTKVLDAASLARH